jgi:hypothetical protein
MQPQQQPSQRHMGCLQQSRAVAARAVPGQGKHDMLVPTESLTQYHIKGVLQTAKTKQGSQYPIRPTQYPTYSSRDQHWGTLQALLPTHT